MRLLLCEGETDTERETERVKNNGIKVLNSSIALVLIFSLSSVSLCFIPILKRQIKPKKNPPNVILSSVHLHFVFADHLILKSCDLDIKFLKSCFFFLVGLLQQHSWCFASPWHLYSYCSWNEFETHKNKINKNYKNLNIKKTQMRWKPLKMYILCVCRTDFETLICWWRYVESMWTVFCYTSKNVSKIFMANIDMRWTYH